MNQSGLKISNDQKVFSEPCKGLVWTTKRLGGTMTDITINNDGTYGFNGTSSKINYNIPELNGIYSIRIICNPTNFSNARYLFDPRGSNNDGIGYIILGQTTGNINVTSGTAYVNGVAITNTTAGVDNEIVITGISLLQGTGANLTLIGSKRDDNAEFLGTIDPVEIYEGILSASEVSNLNNKKSRVALTNTDDITILSDLKMTYGVIEDKYHTITNTGDVQVEQAGGKTAAKFTGSNNLAYASDIIGVNNALVFIPIKIDDLTTDQYLFGNDNFQINYYAANNRIGVSRDDSTYTYSANNSIVNTGWYFIGVYSTSTSTGIYIGTIKDAMAVSGTPASAGTLTAGTALKIGANSGGNLTGSIDSCFIEAHGSHNTTVALQRFEQLHTRLRTNIGG